MRSGLESAILNLTINARDAMPEGGAISLTTNAIHLARVYAEGGWQIPAGHYVMIAVNDQGHGMSEDVQNRLFEPFFTTKPEGKGSGLGLPMVHGFVRQSNGYIIVYSTVGHGSTVKLYFPSAHKSPAETPAARSKPQPSKGHEAVLLVENDRGVRDIMQAFLTPLGYQVLTAERAAQALDILDQQKQVDLLMTDIILGGRRTGIELAQEAGKTHPDIAIVLVSGYADPTITGQLAGLARIGWLAKPFGQDALAERVRAVLDS
ncbi:ATP-binding protein [Aquibaculum sediminis]|uniref:ATP-binding protein n=1 Tax=Aquibaculum sediminis TaxID=3231907 RepID=UPI0034530A09